MLFNTMENMNNDSSMTTEKTFDVDMFRPEDADSVVSLFRCVHGDDYPIKIFYDPAGLIKANREGDYYTVVARSADGRIIGVHNLFRSAPSRQVYEWGVGLVLKEWRSQGVSAAIEKTMNEQVVTSMGMHTVFGEPVTNHVAMQKEGLKFGYHVTALEVGLMPGEAYSGEGVTASRVSTLLFFRVYRNIAQQIFLPKPYCDSLKRLYEKFSEGRVFTESISPIIENSCSSSRMEIFDFAKVARIAFHETGWDFAERLAELESEAVSKGSIVIQVWVRLTEPWVGRTVEILRENGYFLGGLLPQWFDDDGVLMQKLFYEPEFESIQLYSDDSKKLLELVRSDWRRVCSK